MKKLFLITFSLMAVLTVKAQDIIILHNGDEIKAVVMKVGTTEIEYKKYENKETSPVYTITKDKVFMIRYADGTKDVFKKAEEEKPGEKKPDKQVSEESSKKQKNDSAKIGKTKFRFHFGFSSNIYNSYRGGDELEAMFVFVSHYTNYYNTFGTSEPVKNMGSGTYLGFRAGFSLTPKYRRLRFGVDLQGCQTFKKALWRQSVAPDAYNGPGTGNGQYFGLSSNMDVNEYYYGATFINIVPTLAYALNEKQTILWLVEPPGLCIAIAYGQNQFFGSTPVKKYGAGVGILWATGNDWMVTKHLGISTRFGYRWVQTNMGDVHYKTYNNSIPIFPLHISWSGWYGTTGLIVSF